jgi:hypothetical protein
LATHQSRASDRAAPRNDSSTSSSTSTTINTNNNNNNNDDDDVESNDNNNNNNDDDEQQQSKRARVTSQRGDLIVGVSDGVARVWSRAASRCAPPLLAANYQAAVDEVVFD